MMITLSTKLRRSSRIVPSPTLMATPGATRGCRICFNQICDTFAAILLVRAFDASALGFGIGVFVGLNRCFVGFVESMVAG